MKMKRNEFFKHISSDKMPDIEQVRENCINQTANKTAEKNKGTHGRKQL